MHVLNGHFEKGKLILDDPVPENLPENTRVRITVEPVEVPALDQIAAIARPLGLPNDFALNHKHYVKGAPKR